MGGYVTRIIYQGTWASNRAKQGGYLNSGSGRFLGMVAMNEKNQVRCIFEIYETEYIDTPLLESFVDVPVTSKEQSVFANTQEQQDLIQKHSLFSSTQKQKCTVTVNYRLVNKTNQKEVPVTSNDIGNVWLEGEVSSEDCGLEFTLESGMSSPELLKAFLFTVVQVAFCSLGIHPLYRMLKRNNMNRILVISEWAFMFNIMVDLVLVVINLTFSMRILVEYFEFLTVVTMFFMFSILFKIRFFLYSNEIRQAHTNLNPQRRTRRKFLFMIKFVALCIAAVACGNFLIQYEFLFYVFFAYPLFQVAFNFHGVTQKNCFLWGLHLPFVLAQLFYPIFMKGLRFSFFKLTPKRYFPLILLAEAFFGLGLLFLQKCFGACFFLPKCLIPNYFNYFRRFSSYPVEEGENCPICFSGLTENPDDAPDDPDQDPKTLGLLPKKYMETPCKHRFHEQCLRNWMEQKLICPCCRSNIPPVI